MLAVELARVLWCRENWLFSGRKRLG